MKTEELTGGLLDYWVAKAQRPIGVEIFIRITKGIPQCILRGGDEDVWFCPSIKWAQGGPIIDREKIAVWGWGNQAAAAHPNYSNHSYYDVGDGTIDATAWRDCATGETFLIAAMRAYVASKFGEEVPDDTQCDPPPTLTPR